MNVVPYVSKGDTQAAKLLNVLEYLQGLALANNLDFEVDGKNIFLKGGDFPAPKLLSLGFIDPSTKEQFDSLNWDALRFGGKYFLEVPKAHEDYIDIIEKIERFPYTLEFNIIQYDSNLENATGVDIGTFINANLNLFDLVQSGNIENFLIGFGNQSGITARSTIKKIKSYLKDTQTTTLRGQIGDLSLISIGDNIPYKTNQYTADGIQISSDLNFVEAGFSLKVDSRDSREGYVFDFQINNSSADFSNTVDGIPLIKQRLISTKKVLAVGESVEIARLETSNSVRERKGLPFFKKFLSNSDRFSKSTTSILVKRVD
jgi:hypothetical protein